VPERDYYGRFLSREDGPGLMDPHVPFNPALLRERARTAARFARLAGNPSPASGLATLRTLHHHLDRLELWAVANARSLGWS
jgi:hypothetical protein